LQTVEDVNDDLNDVDMLFKTVIQKSAMQFAEKEWKEFEKVEIKLLIMSQMLWSSSCFTFLYQTESSSDSSQINSSAHSIKHLTWRSDTLQSLCVRK
jgi:hypothetical protein